MDITIGLQGTAETLVEREDTALEVGSGSLLVYATPCMAALMAPRRIIRAPQLPRKAKLLLS